MCWHDDPDEYHKLWSQLVSFFNQRGMGVFAEDYASEVIEHGLKELSQGKEFHGGYLMQKARWLAIDVSRQKILPAGEYPTAVEPITDTAVDDTCADTEQFLESLPELDREVLKLRLQGYNWTEAGLQVQINKSAAHRTRIRIRTRFQDYTIV